MLVLQWQTEFVVVGWSLGHWPPFSPLNFLLWGKVFVWISVLCGIETWLLQRESELALHLIEMRMIRLKCGMNSNTRFSVVFQDNLGKPVPEYHRSGFHWSKDDRGGTDNWSCKMSKLQSNGHHQHTDTQLFTARYPSWMAKWYHYSTA